MKVRAFSAERVTEKNPNGKCVLDLTVEKDIITFGGQGAVDEFVRNHKIQVERIRLSEEEAEQSLIDKGEIEPRSIQ